MTLQCACGGSVEQTDNNGVVSPADGDRVEYYTCVDCGREGVLTLRVSGGSVKTGCLTNA